MEAAVAAAAAAAAFPALPSQGHSFAGVQCAAAAAAESCGKTVPFLPLFCLGEGAAVDACEAPGAAPAPVAGAAAAAVAAG